MAKMRVGLVGAGWVSEYHLGAWQRLSDRAQVVAICDPDANALQRRARDFGIEETFTSAEAMVDAMTLDALDICAPREFHLEMVRLGAGNGLAVLCQKPLAPTFGEAEALVAEIGGSVPFMVNENWRFRAYYRRLREWIDAGRLGDIRQVQFQFLSSGMIPGGTGERPALVRQPMFRGLKRLLVMEVLIHHLDSLRFLLGDLRVLGAHLERTNNEIVGEDVAGVALQRKSDGVPVFVTGNLAVPGAAPAPKDQLTLIGSKGVARLDGTTLTLEGDESDREEFDPMQTYLDSYHAAIAHFVDGVCDGGAFETHPKDNLETLRLVEDAYALSGFENRGGA
ncbi:NADH-dependent dehydrogenase [Devosia pacifica]|uniref:NADH-dependent dehydrogenase n=1 Tax=Devosia pacifica TaxID=1335967 RepID=A0A918VS95_9HYPH|nr:Gfo/Idh/MocA family oxidoreductase [Devosia pacifica]GHA18180.1 NADH-dependent dehydrogenase [Devosia pacifica]